MSNNKSSLDEFCNIFNDSSTFAMNSPTNDEARISVLKSKRHSSKSIDISNSSRSSNSSSSSSSSVDLNKDHRMIIAPRSKIDLKHVLCPNQSLI